MKHVSFDHLQIADEEPIVESFITGEVDAMHLGRGNYPNLSPGGLSAMRVNYEPYGYDESVANSFELAQLNFMRAVARAIKGGANGEHPNNNTWDRIAQMSEELYGSPKKEICAALLRNILSSKPLDETRGKILDELQNGFCVGTTNGESFVDGLDLEVRHDEEIIELPRLAPETIEWLQESMRTMLEPAQEIVKQYWAERIMSKEKGNRKASAQDILEIFTRLSEAYRENGMIDFAVMMDEDSSILAWSREINGVKVGGKRSPVANQGEMLGVFTHEVLVHGLRWYNAKQDKLPEIFSEGYYSVDESGVLVNWEVFEEGLATVLQKAVRGKGIEWDMSQSDLYIIASLIAQGRDERSVYEIVCRLRQYATNKELTDETQREIADHTTRSMLRMRRGMSELSSAVNTYNLSYVHGRFSAIDYLNLIAAMPEPRRSELWADLFLAKIDNSDSTQARELAEARMSAKEIE